ncbi:MAG: SH3 domain-containing protein [Anaerolineaceae bacterium]|jgi:hypothetical protein|nr:SH3 domain-containing protein [Anaerolineaceae bacterium]
MSLPSSEPLPDDINELTPARQRHLRRMPRSASPAEHEILMESLLTLTAPKVDFFILAVLGSLSIAASLYFNEPILLVLSVVLSPFLSPIFSLALLPAALKPGKIVKSAITLVIAIIFAFMSGVLVGLFAPDSGDSRLAILHFIQPYWLDAALVTGSSIFSAMIILRQDRLPHLAGALLSYEILIPLAMAGYGLALGQPQLWPGMLLTAFLYLGLALVIAIFTYIILGILPDSLVGWLFALLPLVLSLALFTATLFINSKEVPVFPVPTITSTQAPSQTPSPKAVEATATATEYPPTATLAFTPTQTATEPDVTPTMGTITPTLDTPTATATPTLAPTETVGIVYAENGAVVREGPDFSNPVVAYVYHGERITILGEATSGYTLWYEIEKSTGEVGWLLGSLVRIPTPSP